MNPSIPKSSSPIFIGGSLDDHIFFMLSLCRLEHTALSLVLVHYATWSIVHISLSIILQSLLGTVATFAIMLALNVWAIRLDRTIGAFYSFLLLLYWAAAYTLKSDYLSEIATSTLVAASAAALFLAIGFEASCHVLIQGPLPGPPSEKIIKLPAWQGPLIGLYFVILYGLFFMSLDMAMRFLSHNPPLHKHVNATLRVWHQIEADNATHPSTKSYHLMALKTCL
jgi:hypothetical protein